MRKASFWAAVAAVSVLANYGLSVLTAKVKSPGLARFTAVTHSSGGA